MGELVLIARKKVSQFIEKQFRYFGYDFNHDDYKKIVYGEKGFTTPLEERLKAYYDAYMFLLNNAKNPLSRSIINSFYYLIFGEKMEETILLSIQTKLIELCEYSPIEKACEFHIFVYEQLSHLCLLERQVVALMFMNYVLVKHDIPAIKIVGKEIELYISKRKKYSTNKEEMFLFIKKIIENSFVLEKAYINNLKPITTANIFDAIIEMENLIKNKFRIEAVYLYGSFSKGTNRFDSDVDLLIKTSLESSYEERVKVIGEFKKALFDKFQRFVDVEEIREFFDDDFVKEATEIRRIL